MMDKTDEITLVDGKFKFKILPNGSVNKRVVICTLCGKEFAYHKSTSTLRYHLNAKHASVQLGSVHSASRGAGASKRCGQSTLPHMSGFKFRNKVSKATSRWIAVDCRPLSMVEDRGLQEALQMASVDDNYQLTSRRNMSQKIQHLYDGDGEVKQVLVKTGDHWATGDQFEMQNEDGDGMESSAAAEMSPLGPNLTRQDPDEEHPPVASTSSPAPPRCPGPQPQVPDVMTLCWERHHDDPLDAADHTQHILKQFSEVMLADMGQIRDPQVLMKLRRDITDLVFRAVQEDMRRRPPRPQSECSWRQWLLKRNAQGCEATPREKWDESRHTRRTSRGVVMQPVQQSAAADGVVDALIPPLDMDTETEAHGIKIEDETGVFD